MVSGNPVVRDLAIPLEKYPHLRESNTLHEAVEMITSYTSAEDDRITYAELLVMNDRNQLSGHATLQDILQSLNPRLQDGSMVKQFAGKRSEFPDLTYLWEESFFVECKKRTRVLIRDFMSPIKHSLKGSDPVLKALIIMINAKETVLPVIDEDRVIGVIRLKEIFRAVCEKCNL
jgi:CBS domain-containing protein